MLLILAVIIGVGLGEAKADSSVTSPRRIDAEEMLALVQRPPTYVVQSTRALPKFSCVNSTSKKRANRTATASGCIASVKANGSTEIQEVYQPLPCPAVGAEIHALILGGDQINHPDADCADEKVVGRAASEPWDFMIGIAHVATPKDIEQIRSAASRKK